MSIIVRSARPEDVKRIVEINFKSWVVTYPNTEIGLTSDMIEKMCVEVMQDRIKNWTKFLKETLTEDKLVLVAEFNGDIVAYCNIYQDSGIGYLKAIYKDPEFKIKGAGGSLIREALQWFSNCEKVIVEAAAYNKNAINFYKHFGFRENGLVCEPFSFGGVKIPQVQLELICDLN